MRATLMYAAGDVRVEDVPGSVIKHPTDALVRITASCICGSDLHPYHSLTAADGPARLPCSQGAHDDSRRRVISAGRATASAGRRGHAMPGPTCLPTFDEVLALDYVVISDETWLTSP
jgi:hypothetical protein